MANSMAAAVLYAIANSDYKYNEQTSIFDVNYHLVSNNSK